MNTNAESTKHNGRTYHDAQNDLESKLQDLIGIGDLMTVGEIDSIGADSLIRVGAAISRIAREADQHFHEMCKLRVVAS